MRKIVDIGPDIESLGRYYFKESSTAVIYLIRIINYDIQAIYKRILDYIRKKITIIETLLEDKGMTIGMVIEK